MNKEELEEQEKQLSYIQILENHIDILTNQIDYLEDTVDELEAKLADKE